MARENLIEPELSPDNQMRNLLVIAGTTDDWDEAASCRGKAEHIWDAGKRMTRQDQEASRAALDQVREILGMVISDQQACGRDKRLLSTFDM